MIAAVLFDVYGTLLDVHSAVAQAWSGSSAAGELVSRTWRAKQLEYTWTYSLRGEYRAFRDLTEAALDFALAVAKVTDMSQRARLLEAYEHLAAFSDVVPALSKLKAGGIRLAALSNGDPDMLEAGLRSSECLSHLDAVLSVAPLKIFKPDRRVYELGREWAGVAASNVAFVSANAWDAGGAAAFGFRTFWLNRAGLPSEYGLDQSATKILGLQDMVAKLR